MATEILKIKYANTLVKPRITEKASFVAEKNVYVFETDKNASKSEIKKAIQIFYKVTPIKINIVKNPKKQVFVRGKKGFKGGVKKAYVYLKKGDKLE